MDTIKDPSLEKKSFILVIPNDFGIYKIFNHNLTNLGFDLTSIVPQEFKYPNFKGRFLNFIIKLFTGKNSYKQKLIKQFHSDNIFAITNNLEENSVDYVLVIRPDLLDQNTTATLLKIGKKVVAYQWDGLERFPQVFDFINHYKNFLIFDINDFEKYKPKYKNLIQSESFYFDFDDGSANNHDSNVVYYIGNYIANRSEDLLSTLDLLKDLPVSFDIKLRHHPKTQPLSHANILFFRNYIDFETNLKYLKQAKILLDFKAIEHDGLSLRFFEAMRYEKKIITNNKSVLNYEFYNPNNIFILNHDSNERLKEFVESSYESLPKEIVEKYSFSNWLKKYVL